MQTINHLIAFLQSMFCYGLGLQHITPPFGFRSLCIGYPFYLAVSVAKAKLLNHRSFHFSNKLFQAFCPILFLIKNYIMQNSIFQLGKDKFIYFSHCAWPVVAWWRGYFAGRLKCF